MSHTLESTAQVLIEHALDLHACSTSTRHARAGHNFSRYAFLMDKRHRAGQLTPVPASAAALASDDPAVTVIKVDTAERTARLRRRLHQFKTNYGHLLVVMGTTEFNRPDIRSLVIGKGAEVFVEELDKFDIDHLRPWIARLIATRNAAAHAQPAPAASPAVAVPPPGDPLDVSARVRDPDTGRLDARRISNLLGITITDLAEKVCGTRKQNLSQNPTSASIQAKLQPLEDVAQALLWCGGSEPKLRAWLNRPNRDFPEVDGKKPSPLDLILRGHADLVAQKVHNLRTGQPS